MRLSLEFLTLMDEILSLEVRKKGGGTSAEEGYTWSAPSSLQLYFLSFILICFCYLFKTLTLYIANTCYTFVFWYGCFLFFGVFVLVPGVLRNPLASWLLIGTWAIGVNVQVWKACVWGIGWPRPYPALPNLRGKHALLLHSTPKVRVS